MTTAILGTTNVVGAIGGTLDVSLPAQAVPGSLLVAVVSTSSLVTLTSYSSGWTYLGMRSTNQIRSLVFFKKATGSDALAVVFGAGTSHATICFALDSGDYVDGVSAEPTRLNSPSSAFAPVSGERDYLFLAVRACYGDNVPTVAPSPFGGMVTALGGASAVSLAVATFYGAANYSVASGVWTSTGDFTCAAWTLAAYTCPAISGVITDPQGGFSPVTVRVYDSITGSRPVLSGGRFVEDAVCSAVDGTFSVQCPNAAAQNMVIAVAPGAGYRSLILDRVLPS